MQGAAEIKSQRLVACRRFDRIVLVASVVLPLSGCISRTTGDLQLAACQDAISAAASDAGCRASSSTDSTPTGSIPASDPGKPGGAEDLASKSNLTVKTDVAGSGHDSATSRSAVFPQIASASPDFTSVISPNGFPAAPSTGADKTSKKDDVAARKPNDAKASRKTPHKSQAGLSLNEAVAYAVLSHPAMGAQAAKVQSTIADIHGAEAAKRPTLEVFGGSGGSLFGSYQNSPRQFKSVNVPPTERTDIGFTFRQLVYDFGAARAEIARNRSLADAERLRLADQAEDIALRTVNSYLNLLEQSELLGLIDRTAANQRKLSGLVKLNEQNGNGTQADVDRIKAKVIETEAMRSDINTAYHVALDEFHRLTSLEPKQVNRPKSLADQIPKTVAEAIAATKTSNASLLALRATGASFGHALTELDAQSKPRLDLQGDGQVRHYIGRPSASAGAVDVRAMLMVSYKLMDGGLLKAQTERILANQRTNEFKTLDEEETIELNLRRFYQSLSANRAKRAAAANGVATTLKVNDLYIEQFKAGKRTIFELLDSNMMVFTMQKNRINGEYEQMRAIYGILRNLGRLTEAVCKA